MLYRLIEKIIRNPGRVRIRRKIALGHEDEKILGVAHEENIDLVVLETKSATIKNSGKLKKVRVKSNAVRLSL